MESEIIVTWSRRKDDWGFRAGRTHVMHGLQTLCGLLPRHDWMYDQMSAEDGIALLCQHCERKMKTEVAPDGE